MTPEDRRRRENADLVRRMRQGDNLCHTDLSAFSWQPRPIIRKDRAEMSRLFGDAVGERSSHLPHKQDDAGSNPAGVTKGAGD